MPIKNSQYSLSDVSKSVYIEKLQGYINPTPKMQKILRHAEVLCQLSSAMERQTLSYNSIKCCKIHTKIKDMVSNHQ